MSQKSVQELQEMIEELQKQVRDGLDKLAQRVAKLERQTNDPNRSGVRPTR